LEIKSAKPGPKGRKGISYACGCTGTKKKWNNILADHAVPPSENLEKKGNGENQNLTIQRRAQSGRSTRGKKRSRMSESEITEGAEGQERYCWEGGGENQHGFGPS